MNPPRRPRKLFKLLLFLLVGGAIINVAVAWGCAISWSRTREAQSVQEANKYLTDGKVWLVQRLEFFGLVCTESGFWNMVLTDDSETTQ